MPLALHKQGNLGPMHHQKWQTEGKRERQWELGVAVTEALPSGSRDLPTEGILPF